MSRTVKRVPLDFDWPLNEVWEGYIRPVDPTIKPCPDCKSGYSPQAERWHDQWYGNAPFTPADNGSTPFSPEHPKIWGRAERNIADSPGYYGTGTLAVFLEANRLARFFNGAWCHHLVDQDVAALVKADRLVDFTHTFIRGQGWVKKDPVTVPTPAQVNEWSLAGFGHDAINAYIVVKARCKREGVPLECPTCEGAATVREVPLTLGSGQRAPENPGSQTRLAPVRDDEENDWERTEPPTGDGWQLWETVSEGSPVTPVFPTAEALAAFLVETEGYRPSAAWRLIAQGGTVGSFVGVGGKVYDAARDADVLAGDVPDGTEVTVEATVTRPQAIEK